MWVQVARREQETSRADPGHLLRERQHEGGDKEEGRNGKAAHHHH